MIESYITFRELPVAPGRKTKTYKVQTASDGTLLGLIMWHRPWRQYCFFPRDTTVWSPGCLRDVETFIDGLMAERRS